jgi:hypothetical protein
VLDATERQQQQEGLFGYCSNKGVMHHAAQANARVQQQNELHALLSMWRGSDANHYAAHIQTHHLHLLLLLLLLPLQPQQACWYPTASAACLTRQMPSIDRPVTLLLTRQLP